MFGKSRAPLPPGYQRHALGLPAGSIRAMLALGILGLLWLLVLRYDDNHKLPVEFVYLQFLMLLMLASYLTAHGKTIGPRELAAEAVHLMELHRITALPVADERGRLIGALNVHDLFRAGVM